MADDFVDMIELLNKHKVEYCLIGGFAYSHYVEARATKDIDILVKPDLENIRKMYLALKDFGLNIQNPTPEQLLESKEILWFGQVPNRFDFLQDIDNVPDKEIWPHRETGKFRDIDTYFIGLKQLMKNKISAGRNQDNKDVTKLKKVYPKEYEQVMSELQNNKPDVIKEPSAPYSAITIRNESALDSFRGFPMEAKLRKQMDETALLLNRRKDLTQVQKHTLARLLSSHRFEALWHGQKHTPETRIAAAELAADPDNGNRILRDFSKQERSLICESIIN